MKKRLSFIPLVLMAGLFCSNLSYAEIGEKFKTPKNVIVMISDGCGYNHIQTTDLYQNGRLESQSYEQFPIKYFMSTYPAECEKPNGDLPYSRNTVYNSFENWTNFFWKYQNPTCSGAAATAMATGVKTFNGSIGMDINRKKVMNLSEYAKLLKKSTGVVTSVPWSHATPAGFVAHCVDRDNYPYIAKDMLFNSQTDVMMGAGNPDYDDNSQAINSDKKNYGYVGSKLIWNILKNAPNSTTFKVEDDSVFTVQDCDFDGKPDPWTLIESKEDFIKLKHGKTPKRVVGTAEAASTLQEGRGLSVVDYLEGTEKGKEAPFKVPFNKNVPELSDMALGAINVLQQNKNGFFIMIEGGAIDWAAHSNMTGRMIEEEMAFNATVDSVIHWIETYSSWDETLLIVTADHETGYLTSGEKGAKYPDNMFLKESPKGVVPKIKWNHKDHTNDLVPIFAKGAGANILSTFADEIDLKRGKFINNTEIAQAIFLLWNQSGK